MAIKGDGDGTEMLLRCDVEQSTVRPPKTEVKPNIKERGKPSCKSP